MRKAEQRLWDRMRKHIGLRVRLERIENLVGTGRPDVDALIGGVFTPVELKAVMAWPARAATPVLGRDGGLNLDQRNWHLDWCSWGGRSLVVVGVGSRDIFTFSGMQGDQINQFTRDDFYANTLASDWDALVELLKKGKR